MAQHLTQLNILEKLLKLGILEFRASKDKTDWE